MCHMLNAIPDSRCLSTLVLRGDICEQKRIQRSEKHCFHGPQIVNIPERLIEKRTIWDELFVCHFTLHRDESRRNKKIQHSELK